MLVITFQIDNCYGITSKLFIILILVHGYYMVISMKSLHLIKIRRGPYKFKSASAFNKCLNNIKMIDLGFSVPRFTCTNKPKFNHNKTFPNSIIMERLDKFYANNKWLELF